MSARSAAMEAIKGARCLHARTITEGGPFVMRDGSMASQWTDIGCAGPGKRQHPECVIAAVCSEAVREALVGARTWPCALCRGTGVFEYDDDCGDSTCGAPHPTKRVTCGTCRGERFTPIGATATDAILAALEPA